MADVETPQDQEGFGRAGGTFSRSVTAATLSVSSGMAQAAAAATTIPERDGTAKWAGLGSGTSWSSDTRVSGTGTLRPAGVC